MTLGDPLLDIRGVTRSYGNEVAVDDLSFTVERGEIFGLLGPNGAGKSTTIHMAVGLLAPDRGAIELVGEGSPEQARVRRHIGVAPQALAIYEELTAEENLRFYGKLFGLAGRELAARVDAMLAFSGLEERRGKRVSKFSGGMKRRLNIAVALVADPKLLLLDEPTVGVDPQSRNAIFESILALEQQGLTVLYTTHYMEEAQRLCDRVGILDHGKLLALDTVDGLIDAYGGRSVITTQDAAGGKRIETDDAIGELTRLLESEKPLGIKIDRPDLETVFLNLTGRSLRD